jgi:tetratricopeptide (TPR) repeat protein
LPVPSTPATALGGDGRQLVDQAFAKSKTAKSDSDYTEVIDLCGRGRAAGIRQNYEDYTRRLMGWSYNRRGELRAEAGRDTEALADFEMAVESSPNSWRAIHNRGVSYAALGRLDEAMVDFERTIELNADYPNAYFNRAELRYRRGDFNGAVDDYTAALKAGKPDPVVLNSRGHAFYRLERFGEALRDYSAAIEMDPRNAAAWINRGDTYADLGQYGEAANDYRGAIKADPQLARAYQSTAWLMATCPDAHYRNDKGAIEAARKALSLGGGSDYRDLETLAAAQANAGLFAEAKRTQETAIAKAPAGHRVGAEKRLALYQHDRPFREMPRTAFEPSENEPEHPVRRASATEPVQPQTQRRRPYRGANRY